MKQTSFHALGAALAFALFLAPLSGAFGQQTISISGPATLGYDVCGNATDTLAGDCALLNDQDGNTVSIGSGVALGNHFVYGRFHEDATATTATNNRVGFSGDGFYIYGGVARSTADNLDATSTGNRVSVSGAGAFATNVIGGNAECKDHCIAEASNNTVSITGGSVRYDIHGGYAYASGNDSRMVANNNTVEIGGSADITGAGLHGGYLGGDGTSAGNTLNLHLSEVNVADLDKFQILNFHLPSSLGNGGSMLSVIYRADLGADAAIGVAVASGSKLKAGDQIVLIDVSSGIDLQGAANPNVTSLTPGYAFKIVNAEWANKKLVVELTAVPKPPAPPRPPLPPPPPPPSATFTDGGALNPGASYTAPSGNPSFCLGGSTAPVMVRIDNVPYTLQARDENTCFEIFGAGNRRALILSSGSAEIGSIVPGATLLQARNGDLVSGNGKIRARLDPTCTSTRITVLDGNVSAPSWITAPMPAAGCPEDALTPAQNRYMFPGGLACNPSALKLKGTYAKLTVKHSQSLSTGQQYFTVAGHADYGWYQNNTQGWRSLDEPFLPLATATATGPHEATLVDALDIRDIPNTELYIGYGANADEMMMNGRYCGVFRVAR